MLCFFVLLFVLKKLLFDPLTRFMDARRARVDEALETERQAQQARAENDEAPEEIRSSYEGFAKGGAYAVQQAKGKHYARAMRTSAGERR